MPIAFRLPFYGGEQGKKPSLRNNAYHLMG